MIAFFKYQKDCHIEENQDLFSLIPVRNNGFKLLEGRLQSNFRKCFLRGSTTVKPGVLRGSTTVKPGEVLDSSELTVFKQKLDSPLSKMF